MDQESSKTLEPKPVITIEKQQNFKVDSDNQRLSEKDELKTPSTKNEMQIKRIRKYRNRFKWMPSSIKSIINSKNNKLLKTLKYNLLMEEINASKAFSELCQMVLI